MRIDRDAANDLFKLLDELYGRQRRERSTSYLDEHSRPAVIRHQINVFGWYASHLPDSGAVLDWGCHHGPDSCLLRRTFGDRLDLHACDPSAANDFPVFREFARAKYQQLTTHVALPYPDATFDAVIASGVLEHVAMDYESLKELWRVLKVDGLLFISYLPYRLSWSEWRLRAASQHKAHRRTYGKREFAGLLKRAGLYPEVLGYHTFLPNRFASGPVDRVKAWLSRQLSPRIRHSTMFAAARKVVNM